jgi:phosphoribosylglycinamide formyltransferase
VTLLLDTSGRERVNLNRPVHNNTMTDAAEQRRIVVLISGSGLYATSTFIPTHTPQTTVSASVSHTAAGTNLQALIDAQNTPALPDARIVLVVSNRKAAHGLVRAQSADPPIPTRYLALQPYLKAAPTPTPTPTQTQTQATAPEGQGEEVEQQQQQQQQQPRTRTRDTYDAEIARIVLGARPDVVVLAGWMHVFGEAFLDAVASSAPVINLHPALPGAFDGANAIERGYEAFQRGDVERVGAMVHRVVKEVDRGEPVVVREVEIRKGEPLAAYEERLHRTEWEIIVEATQKVLCEVRPT